MKPAYTALLLLSLMVGCNKADNHPPAPTNAHKDSTAGAGGSQQSDANNVHGHSHERGKMLLADVGTKYHALLTAHLSSKDGNELDIFFETPDEKKPTPVAIPVESLTAHIRAAGADEAREARFEPAPMAERPSGEKAGACSHFVAKVPWMKADATLNVVVPLTLEGDRYRITWDNFNPRKYAHHQD